MPNSNKKDETKDYAYEAIQTVLEELDALVYVADFDTHELLYMSRYGRKIWGDPDGRRCWEVLQSGQSGPCSFCTNHLLRDKDGKPKGVHVWEFQNTVDQRWYQCRDQAIPWVDGRLVRIEIASDITERKNMEEDLRQAHARAEALAYTDDLTGVFSRRGLFLEARKVFVKSCRSLDPVATLMLDVDNFKQINDTWGHSKGDEVLGTVVTTVKGLLRESDILGRLGGDEFVIVLPETDFKQAAEIAERIRSQVYLLFAGLELGDIEISCSIGMVVKKGAEITFDRALMLADRALYSAKLAGRNTVESLQPGEDPPRD
ncbi:MAG: GGDEF domain-containing protein [Pseudohongiellaceae bacterium]|nr:GGDEF domain-containing protein [Pseudohongiellaceae bacterium]